MIQIIAGEKGKGKTKILLDKANAEVLTTKGSLAFIDKNNRHMYELNNKIRGKECKISNEDSKVQVWVVPTNEELVIARDTYRILGF